MHRNPLRGISSGVVFAIAAPLLYSASIPLSKFFLQQTEPWILAGLLDLGAGIGMAIVFLCRWVMTQKLPDNLIHGNHWNWLWASIAAGGLLAPVLQMYGVAHSPAAAASLLLNLEGVFTALIAWIIFREKFDRRVAGGLLAIAAGSIILVWSGGSTFRFSWGSLAVVGASLAWATSSNLTQKVSDRDPLQVTILRTLVSGSFNVVLALAAGNVMPPVPLVGTIALTGFFCIGLTFICYILALRLISTSRVGAFFSLFPFSGAILSVVVLGESVTSSLILAAVFMAFGLWLCLQKKGGASLQNHS